MWQVGSQFSWPGVRGITSQYRHCPRCIIVIIILIMASLASLLDVLRVVLKLSGQEHLRFGFNVDDLVYVWWEVYGV